MINKLKRWLKSKIAKIALRKLEKEIDSMKGSWKTTLAGWLVLIAALAAAGLALIDGDPSTKPDFQSLLEALTALGIGIPTWLGFLQARDKGVSSEQQAAASVKKLSGNTIVLLVLLMCLGAGTIFGQPVQHKIKYLKGHAYPGVNITYASGDLRTATIDNNTVCERWAEYDSTSFAANFVNDTAVTLSKWGPIKAVLDFKLIYVPTDSTAAYVYDIGSWQVNDTIAAPTAPALVPFYAVQDTFYHFIENIFSDTNLPTPVDSAAHYILYLKYLKNE